MPRVSSANTTPVQTQSRAQFVNARLQELLAEVQIKHPKYAGVALNSFQANNIDFGRDSLKDAALNGQASATLMSANADFQLLEYSYHTGEPMRAFLEEMPKDGKLKLQLTITPSGHNGAENATKWAKTNTYNARVGVMVNGRFKELDKSLFDGNGKETTSRSANLAKPNYAPTSPDLEIDLKQFRKDYPGQELVLEGWPNGSAGVGGYIEARRTFIDVNV